MHKLFQKIDHIRARGIATLELEKSSAYYHLNGNSYPLDSMGIPGIKCRITLLVGKEKIDFTIDQVY